MLRKKEEQERLLDEIKALKAAKGQKRFEQLAIIRKSMEKHVTFVKSEVVIEDGGGMDNALAAKSRYALFENIN